MKDQCADFQNSIPAMLLGDPGFTLKNELLAHSSVCPACARELEQYRTTLDKLGSIPDLPVPRHFFVYGESAAKSPWALFRQLQPAWKAAMLAAAAAMLLMAALLTLGAQMRYEAGSLTLSFGQPRDTAGGRAQTDIAALRMEMLQAMDARMEQQHQAWKTAVRIEFSELGAALSDRQRDLLQAGFARLENRFNDRLLTSQAALQGGTEKSLDNLYQLLRLERQQEVTAITDRIDLVAARGEEKAAQTDAILSTLLDAAEQRVRN